MIIDCLSDLHGFFPCLPGKADLLILAGDYTASENVDQWEMFFEWVEAADYRKKVIIGGNHDNFLMHRSMEGVRNFDYLYDSGVEFEGFKIWGTPWTLKFEGINPRCCAFTVEEEVHLAEKWKMIPDDTDILITHGPAFGLHDEVEGNGVTTNVGSTSLSRWIHDHLDSLKLHVCGHIHEARYVNDFYPPFSLNCSYVDKLYMPANKPVRVEINRVASPLRPGKPWTGIMFPNAKTL